MQTSINTLEIIPYQNSTHTLTYSSHSLHSRGLLHSLLLQATTHNSHFTILQHTLTYSPHSRGLLLSLFLHFTLTYTSLSHTLHSRLYFTLTYTSRSSTLLPYYTTLHYSTLLYLVIQITKITYVAYRCRCH